MISREGEILNKILVVDDTPDIFNALAMSLESRCYHVVISRDSSGSHFFSING